MKIGFSLNHYKCKGALLKAFIITSVLYLYVSEIRFEKYSFVSFGYKYRKRIWGCDFIGSRYEIVKIDVL